MRIGQEVIVPLFRTRRPTRWETVQGRVVSFDAETVVVHRELDRDELLDGEPPMLFPPPHCVFEDFGPANDWIVEHPDAHDWKVAAPTA